MNLGGRCAGEATDTFSQLQSYAGAGCLPIAGFHDVVWFRPEEPL